MKSKNKNRLFSQIKDFQSAKQLESEMVTLSRMIETKTDNVVFKGEGAEIQMDNPAQFEGFYEKLKNCERYDNQH